MQIHLTLFTFQTDFLNGRKPTPFPCTTALPSVGTKESWKERYAQGSAPNPSGVKTVGSILREHAREACLGLSSTQTRPPRPTWLALAWVQSTSACCVGPAQTDARLPLHGPSHPAMFSGPETEILIDNRL